MNRDGGEPVRVLHFTRFINRYDFIDTVIRFADPRHFHMMACTLTDQSTIESPGYGEESIPHWVLNCDSRRRYPLAVLRLARLLRRERVDILHTHHYEETFIGMLAAALARTRAVIIGRHYHGDLYHAAEGYKRRALLGVEGFCNRRARLIIVPSNPIRNLLVEGQGVPGAKISVVPYGFDFTADRYRGLDGIQIRTLRRQLGIEGAFVVGNVARHWVLKGQDDLLRGFSRFVADVPHARLLMVGDGPDHDRLRTMAESLGVAEAVMFTGWRRDATSLIAAMDVVAHPTLLDSFPQVMIEALIFGKPLIVTNSAGPSDQIQHGRTGLLIPMRDPDAIYDALRWVFGHPDEARELGDEGRRYVLEELDIRKAIKRYEACYERALASAN